MRKKTIIHLSTFLLLFFGLSVSGFSQNPKGMNSFFCCEGHNPCLHFTSQADLDCHNFHIHGIGDCEKSGGFVGFVKSPIKIGIAGSIPGALIGSFPANNGKAQTVPGLMMGYSAFSTLSLLFTTKNRSLGENVVLGIVAGGAGGAGYGMYEKANANSTATSTKPDNTVKYAVVAAAAVGLAGAVLPNEGKNKAHKSSSFFRKEINKLVTKMSFGFTGSGIGITVKL